MSARLERTSDQASVVAGQLTPQVVHRASVSEVFVTDVQVTGDGTFAVDAVWPAQHPFFGPNPSGTHDPLLYVETVRQAALLIAHRAYNSSLNDRFVPHHLSWSINPDGLRSSADPVNLTLTANGRDIRGQGGELDGMRLDFDCFRDGYQVGVATEVWSFLTPQAYQQARGDNFGAEPYQATLLPTVDPELVGRTRAEDVVIAETPLYGVWSLQFDLNNPVLFGRPADHVPSMVMLEGARQVALMTVEDPAALPLRAEFTFTRCIEFDEPCLIVADEDPPADDDARVISLTFEQDGRPAASGTIAMLEP
jgi:2-oxo-3-(phosphooxy)propyl 3-oxoalkanoate synthase